MVTLGVMIVDEKGINSEGRIVDWNKFDSYMKAQVIKENKEWLKVAILAEPQDSICGWCGGKNDFADDMGFIYTTPYGDDTRATCEYCYHGRIGEMHIRRYGVGER